MSSNPTGSPRRRWLAVAPMLNRTDRHFRYLVRLISRCTWLYTEMVVAQALLHGNSSRLLAHADIEAPLALQLGGSDPAVLARAVMVAVEFGFDEINLNVGCPSPRVSAGRMGACLMAEPLRVGECVAAMGAVSNLPVTVKTRLGIDEYDDFEFLCRFVEMVAAAGCRTFIIHARKAWLRGLDPKRNRTVPPLDYARVRALKAAYPQLEFILNGGLQDLVMAREAIASGLDGAMIGRAAYAHPWCLAAADQVFYGDRIAAPTLAEVLDAYLVYIEKEYAAGTPLRPMLRHIPGLFSGLPGSRVLRFRIGALAGSNALAPLREALAPALNAQTA